ncbi:protein of unknown function [Spirosomataceae bacterium TFI 002]|nr:protein of unknown function [Spirosomataceae bacterium TFI 002]
MTQISRIIVILTSLSQYCFGQVYENFCIDENIKTIELYNNGLSSENTKLNPAVRSLNGSDYLVLEFDDLSNTYKQFHIKLIYCDYKWNQASVREIAYLADFNDFVINDYSNSQSTKVPYYHYGFRVPDVKLSGNYVIQIFESDVYGEPIAQRRFRVFDPKVGVAANVSRPIDNNFWRTHQQVDFAITFGNYDVRNPRTEFLVEIRQNYRDDMISRDLKPSSVNLAKGEANFRFFNNENLFPAGNEFRNLDIRSTFSQGNNVAEITQGFRDRAVITLQENRARKVYLEQFDLNGRSAIATVDDFEAELNGDYLLTEIFYKDKELSGFEELFVVGGFNNFQPKSQDKCEFGEEDQVFRCTQLLKQGMHDFAFAKRMPDRSFNIQDQEGNFMDTGNAYEVFIYHLPPAGRVESLIGYFKIENSKSR